MIRRRKIFHIAGFDLPGPDVHFNRLIRQLEIFRRTWSLAGTVTKAEKLSADIVTSGLNWQTSVNHELWPWDDVVRDYAALPTWRRLTRATLVLWELIRTGTLRQYFRAYLPYGIFTLVPFVQVVLLVAAALLVAIILTDLVGLDGFAGFFVALVTALALSALLLRWPGGIWRIGQALDNLIFTRDHVYQPSPRLKSLIGTWADQLAACSSDPAIDEIVIVGHSVGAMLALEIVADALERHPNLGRQNATICILTVGASIPKFTLYPAADHLRAAVAKAAAEPAIHWAEYHSRNDVIAFYRFHPVALQRFYHDQLVANPVLRRVQIAEMLQPDTYRRYRRRFFRLHYQSVMANDQPAAYDYFMMTCGPISFRHWTTAPRGHLDFVDPGSGGIVAGGQSATPERSEIGDMTHG